MNGTDWHNGAMVRAKIYVDVGWDHETRQATTVSENEIRDDPDSLGGLREAISPYSGDVDLDGRIGLHLSDGREFMGRDFHIEYVRHMLGLNETFCEKSSAQMRLNGQTHSLRASASGERIRLELVHRGSPMDSCDFPREEIVLEWFLAWARFERVAYELGDVAAKELATTRFAQLCPEMQIVVGEDRLMSVLNDPIGEVFGIDS